MATNTGFAPHESINVHEALRSCALQLAKLEIMEPVVKDTELKRFVDQQITMAQKQVEELENWAKKIIA